MLSFLKTRFSPFKSGLYSALFVSQFFSQTGSWAFEIARTWIIVDRLGKGHEIGLVMLAGGASALVFTLYGGLLTDRYNYRTVLQASMLAKLLLFALSIWLFYIVEYHTIAIWHLVLFSFLQGIIVAFDAPAFISISLKLIPPENLQQALALNSMNFQASRTFGPLMAGILMGIHGPGLVILFDGLSFLGPALVTWGVLRQKDLPAMSFNAAASPQGFGVLLKDPLVYRPLLQFFFCLAFFLPTILVTFRIYVNEVFNVTSQAFSYIFMGPALGSLIGALSFTLIKPKFPLRMLSIGLPLFIFSVVATPLFPKYFMPPLALALTVVSISIAGFAAYFSFSAFTVHLHLSIKEAFRGRLTSVILLGFSVIMPMASYPIGKLIDTFSAGFCMILIPGLYVLIAAFIWLTRLLKV